MTYSEKQRFEGARRFWWRMVIGSAFLAPLIAYVVLRWGGVAVYAGGNPSTMPLRDVFGAKAWIIMGVIIALPVFGLAGACVQRRLGFWSMEALVVLFSLTGVLGAEWLVRIHSVQSNLWVAVLSRLDPADWAMREPAQLHYDNLNPPDLRDASRDISVFGSSQSAVNLDRDEMARRLGRPVFRRAINGMFALELCAAQYMLCVPRVETVVFYMSPLDIAGSTSVRADWMRSLISPRSWSDIVRILGPTLTWENRRALTELATAAHLKLWAFRDGARWILFNLAGRSPHHPPRDGYGQPKEPAVQPFSVDPSYVEASFRGYELVMDNLRRMGVDVVVFQGEVRPSFRQQIPDSYWIPTEERIRSLLTAKHIRHVPLDEYRPDIGLADWADNTHMNDTGRHKLTDAVVAELLDCQKGLVTDP